MSYWPHGASTNATSDERRHIVYRAYAPAPTVSSSTTTPIPAGRVVALNPDGYTIALAPDQARRLTVKVNHDTRFKVAPNADTSRSEVKVGDIIMAVGTYEPGSGSSIVARLIVDDAGHLNGQSIVVDASVSSELLQEYSQ
jgi:hypothetical protein